jgi:hypothetical protein
MSKKRLSVAAMVGFLVLAMVPALADSAVPPTFVSGSTDCSTAGSAPGGISLTIVEPVMGSSSHTGPDGSVFQLTGTTRRKFNFSTTALVYDVVVKGSGSNWYDYDGTLGHPVRSDTDLEIPNGNKLNLIHFCYSGNAAPVAVADSYTTNEDTALTVLASTGVLANDSDANGDTLSAIEVSDPANRVTLNSNGSFTFTPAANFNGSYVFSYKANDGFTNSNTVNVTITVNAVNDAPVAVNDSLTGAEDNVITGNVLTNDSDVDGDSLTAIKLSDPVNGDVTLGSNGAVTYTPDANFSGSDSFTYKANDGAADSNIATVTITVSEVNDPPVAGDDAASVVAGGSVLIDVLDNDADADGDPLTIASFTDPANGTVSEVSGELQYQPDSGFVGADDTFTYTVSDGRGGTDTATVTVTVFAGVLACGGDTGLATDASGMSAIFFRLDVGPCDEEKLFTINFDQEVGTNGEIEFLIDPAFTEPAEYTAKLTFEPFTPGNPNTQTFEWDLDLPDTLTAADWCDSATFVGGQLTTAVPPEGKDGCVASQTTQTVGSEGEAQTTWWVYFLYDLKTRG